MLSVVIPCFNEADALGPLAARLRPVLEGLGEDYEVVFVDDGSRDQTASMVAEMTLAWPQVRLCSLVRNSGHQAALSAGLAAASGDFVVTMDADLQDPPEVIPTMLQMARAHGLDVVYAQRATRSGDTAFKRWTAGIYYFAIKEITGIELVQHAGDFRLVSRRVVDVLNALPERRRVYRLLIPWLGFPSGTVQHERDARVAGESKYTLRRMFSLGFDSLASFSSTPLHVATAAGTFVAFLSLLATLGTVAVGMFGHTVPGWASLAAAVLFLGAVQLISLGVLGSYVGRIYDEVRHRPLFLVRDASAAEDDARRADAGPDAR